jgi:hypothetical protein
VGKKPGKGKYLFGEKDTAVSKSCGKPPPLRIRGYLFLLLSI